MIRKIIFFTLVMSSILAGCNKSDDNTLNDKAQFEKDKSLIHEYLQKYAINADSTSDGLFYIIDDSTTSVNSKQATIDSKVTVNYVGYFLDNKVFDSGNNIQFPLSQVIKGWQIGIPVLQEGQSARFFIPSKYGYGAQGNSTVPSNSVLIFDVELLKVE